MSDISQIEGEIVADANVPELSASKEVEAKATVSIESNSNFGLETVKGFDSRVLNKSRQELASQNGLVKLPDAWLAQFSSRTAVTSRPKMIGRTGAFFPVLFNQPEIIQDTDDRVQVEDVSQYPFNCICALRITAADGTRWSGTGWLVNSHTVITAGHCVYLHDHGGWAQNVEVIPGCDGNNQPYGSCNATVVRSVDGWTKNKKSTHDYGAIILPKTFTSGPTEVFRFANLDNSLPQDLIVNLSGYPADKPTYTQWFQARRIDSYDNYNLFYHLDTTGGQSGAPVWYAKEDQRIVVGIHTNGAASGNYATRITDAVVSNLNHWISESS